MRVPPGRKRFLSSGFLLRLDIERPSLRDLRLPRGRLRSFLPISQRAPLEAITGNKPRPFRREPKAKLGIVELAGNGTLLFPPKPRARLGGAFFSWAHAGTFTYLRRDASR